MGSRAKDIKEMPNGGLCPACHDRITGILGVDRYYCSSCGVEITTRGGPLKVWKVLSSGDLRPLRRGIGV